MIPELDLKDVMAGSLASAGARFAIAGATNRRADIARTLADPATVLAPVTELGDLNLRQRDGNQLATRLADHLAVRDIFPQVGLDLATDDLLEPVGVSIDFSNHGRLALPVRYGGLSIQSPRN